MASISYVRILKIKNQMAVNRNDKIINKVTQNYRSRIV